MVSALSSGFSATVFFARRETTQVRNNHDHTPEGCTFCQSKNEKTSTPSVTVSGNATAEAKQHGREKSAAVSSEKASSELTPEEKKQVQELQKRDQEVRLHEQAHLAAAGAHARGGPSFTYQKGPDGKVYAVGGEVPIDLSPVADNPQATIQKAEAIQRAALAPAEPSGPDQQVAAQAAALVIEARQELAQQSQEITSTGKKVGQKLSPSYFKEISSPAHNAQSRQEIPIFSSLDLSPYSQQKQRDSVSSGGDLLNVYI
ncbi:MAG: putative metalloprotease CJM1_0395 family protein [Candidatus Binatia bacterium]